MNRSNCLIEAIRLRLSIPGSRLMMLTGHLRVHFYVLAGNRIMEYRSSRELSMLGKLWYRGELRTFGPESRLFGMYIKGKMII